MYRGKNPSALRSQECIADSCISLMREESLDNISIKQIMERSDLARQTFYQLFASKDEIIEYLIDRLFDGFVHDQKIEIVTNVCDVAKVLFSFLAKNNSLISDVIRNNRTYILQQKLTDYLSPCGAIQFTLSTVANDIEQRYSTSFIIAGIISVFTIWLNEGGKMELEALSDLVCRITNSQSEILAF